MKQMDKPLQDKFHKAVYNNLRGIPNLTDKLTITNIFLVAYSDRKVFADLLYDDNDLTYWIERINIFFQKASGEDDKFLSMSIVTPNEMYCFKEMVKALRETFDNDGYFKALHAGDEYAMAVYEVCKVIEKVDWKNMKENWRCVGEMISEHI